MIKEMRIKGKAKNIFFKEETLYATMRGIANAADINPALINYYFEKTNLSNFLMNIFSLIACPITMTRYIKIY